MNKVINVFSLFLLFLYSIIAIGSIYDLGFSVYQVRSINYIKEITILLSVLVLILGLLRVKRRMNGIKDISSYKKFIYSIPISKNQRSQSIVAICIEIAFTIFFTFILLKVQTLDVHHYVLPMLIVIVVLGIENLIFLIRYILDAKKKRLGISDQFIAHFDREMKLIYYTGLQRIEIYQGMINFKYKKNLNLFLNLSSIPESELVPFFDALKKVLETKNIFFDDSFHQFYANISK